MRPPSNCPLPSRAKRGVVMKQLSQRKNLSSSPDPLRTEFDRHEAILLIKEANALLTPTKPLKTALGGELLPPEGSDMAGLDHALRSPDLIDLEASIQRTQLADKAGVFELALSTAESSKAKGSIQQMLAHQMSAAHKHAMRLLAESQTEKDAIEKCRLAGTASKLMDAFSKAAMALQKLQLGANQIVTVQHVQVNGQAIIGMGGHGK